MAREFVKGFEVVGKGTFVRVVGACALTVMLTCCGAGVGSAQATAQTANAVAHDAKDIAGQWQGTLVTPQASLRLVLQFTKTEKGWAGKFYSIDQKTPGLDTKVTLEGPTLKFAIDLASINYVGTMGADGNSLTGTWTQGGGAISLPLTLVRSSKETAWEIPAPPPPLKKMAADADPAFDVATIKPNSSGAPAMQGLTLNGRDFRTLNSSAEDLIAFAYNVQVKQIVGAPDWMNKERFDIQAVPDIDGAPSMIQLRGMVKKLLADRFKLTFHKDKREMPAYVLTAARGGAKLKPTELSGPLPGMRFGRGVGGLDMNIANGTLADLSEFLQSQVLDRPVVNQTGIEGRYDMLVTFTPDDSEFNGHPPQLPRTEGVETAPALFDAIQKTLGLRLDAQKAAVEVIAIDHVEKYSVN